MIMLLSNSSSPCLYGKTDNDIPRNWYIDRIDQNSLSLTYQTGLKNEEPN